MARKKTVKAASDTTDLAAPQNRTEEFLAKIAGLVDTLPQGEFSRLERYLKYIAENGGGGGGGGVTSFNSRTGAVVPQSGDYSSFYAPSGFGLGASTAKVLSSTDDLDNITEGGFYSWATVPINAPSNRVGCMIVLPPSSVGAMLTQIVYAKEGGATGVNNFISVRCYNPGTSAWGPWEWVNPPMQIDAEYRTTERFLLKPVYVQVKSMPVTIAQTIGAQQKLHNIANILNMVDCSAFLQLDDTTSRTFPLYNAGVNAMCAYAAADTYRIHVIVASQYHATDSISGTAYFVLKYTKTTD